jgi:hypothetical protein
LRSLEDLEPWGSVLGIRHNDVASTLHHEKLQA